MASMIRTREQLEHEIWIILDEELFFQEYDEFDAEIDLGDAVKRIVDLISNLPNMCFHEK